jgi:multidrug efflux system membrane fusion protein
MREKSNLGAQPDINIMKTIRSPKTAAALAAALALAILPSCHGAGKEAVKAQPPAPVLAARAVVRDVPIRLTVVGVVEAYSVVNVKAQIGGALRDVHFREGGEVKKGAVLFTIDPRSQEATLKQAEANLARDKSQLENSRATLRRNAELLKDKYVSAERVDQLRTEVEAMEGAVKAAEAAMENARLLLEYCVIRSPINGVAGAYSITPGNVVKPNDDKPMVTIRQVQPIFASFAVVERHFGQIRGAMAAGQLWAVAAIEGDAGPAPRGKVVFVDNAVDQATGTIRMKAEFDNSTRRLWPGQFISVTLNLGTRPGAVTVPARAVQMGQKGAYVYVVDKDGKAQPRPVTVSGETEGVVVVDKGVAAGELVITEGHIKVAPGAAVAIKEAEGEKEGTK